MSKTIVALATAHGIGSISIIRLNGNRAYDIALLLTHKDKLQPRYAHYCKLFSKENIFIDEAIVIYFKSPYSFTGEDIIEFQIHGGFSISELIIEECIKLGATLAKAGEFSKIACLNGKMNILKAISINELINSKSTQAAKIISRNLEGKLGDLLNQIRLDLVKTLAFVETNIDYADEDLPKDMIDNIYQMCIKNIKILEQIVEISQSKKGLIDGFKIAIIGKPNVGKSSILNSLLSFDRAIVSNIAGTTRDRIEENIKIGTHIVRLVDTAGIRYDSDDSIEKYGIALSLEMIEKADIIIAVFDSSSLRDEDDEELINKLQNINKKVFYILNKNDLKSQFDLKNQEFLKMSAIYSSDILKSQLESYLNSFDTEGIMISNLAVIDSCLNACKAIKKAKEILKENSLELFAFEFNYAINELSKFTKKFQRDEILDEMFSNFCLGK